MRKRVFAVILTMALALTLLPVAANAAGVTEVYVGNIKLDASTPSTTAYGGTASFDAATSTLTLSGVTVPKTASHQIDSSAFASIFADGDLNLVLIGTNSVTGPDNVSNAYGMHINGNLKVSGGGSLTANGGSAEQTYGVFVRKDVNLSSGTLRGIAGGKTSTNFTSSAGVSVVEFLNVSGGSIIGESTPGANMSSHGVIAVGGISLSNGSITGKGAECAHGVMHAEVYGIVSVGTVTVSGGVMTGECGNGLLSRTFAIGSNQQLIFSGGQIVADASASTNGAAFSQQPGFGAIPTWYQWRLASNGAFTRSINTPYTLAAGNTYVNIVPAQGGTGGTEVGIPKTGDSNMPGLWLGVTMISVIGLVGSVMLNRRKQRKDS